MRTHESTHRTENPAARGAARLHENPYFQFAYERQESILAWAHTQTVLRQAAATDRVSWRRRAAAALHRLAQRLEPGLAWPPDAVERAAAHGKS